MEYTILFFTHSGAMKFKRKALEKSIVCELMPVPRNLSSNCSISAKIIYDGALSLLIDDEVEKIFLTEQGKKDLVYEAL